MTLVQPGWNWYVAELVIESRVEGRSDPIVVIESVLLYAESPADAYAKAKALCGSSEHMYRNKFGAKVVQRYVGIHNLENLQTEQPVDGTVLQVRVVTDNDSGYVRHRSELSLFGGERPDFLPLNQ